jgi:hypothetical protein
MAKPNDLAACQATPGSDWILAKVIQHDPASGMYRLSDEDVESNKRKYRVILATMPVFSDSSSAVYRGLFLLTLLVWFVPFNCFHSLSFTRFTSRCPWRGRQAESWRRYLCGLPGHDFLLSSDGSATATKGQSWCLCHGPLCGRLG